MNTTHEYWPALEVLDRGQCLRIAERALAVGHADDLLLDIAKGQERVGQEWAANRWSIAQEHAATAIGDAVLGLVEASVEHSADPKGIVAVTCAEHEWHSMPARLLSVGLGLHGWKVVFFGASLPAAQVDHLTHDGKITAVGVSCTVSQYLPRVRAMAERIPGDGPPLLGGGSGFGPSGRWAASVGVDAFAGTTREADNILTEWQATDRRHVSPIRAPHHTDLSSASLQPFATRAFTAALASEDRQDEPVGSVDEWATQIAGHLHAATLIEDDIFLRFAHWTAEVLGARGLRRSVMADALGRMADEMRDLPDFAEHTRLVTLAGQEVRAS